MKRYIKPTMQKVEFRYEEQVVASGPCIHQWNNIGVDGCVTGEPEDMGWNNAPS